MAWHTSPVAVLDVKLLPGTGYRIAYVHPYGRSWLVGCSYGWFDGDWSRWQPPS